MRYFFIAIASPLFVVGCSEKPNTNAEKKTDQGEQSTQVKDDTEIGALKKRAENGDADAQFKLAHMYENGEGITKDLREAVEWYRKAAEQGRAQAQHNLGWMYIEGSGDLTKNLSEAAKWLHKSAKQGHKSSQNSLGYMYSHGEGVTKDLEEADKWFQKAAEQEDKQAQERLNN